MAISPTGPAEALAEGDPPPATAERGAIAFMARAVTRIVTRKRVPMPVKAAK